MKRSERKIIHPTKVGQIVKFHTPYPDEDPNQLYVLLEIFEYGDDLKPSATIKALIKGWSFLPINKVFLEDLELAEVDTTELIGFNGTLTTENGKRITGRIASAEKEKQLVDLTKKEKQVATNVKVSIKDTTGEIHKGNLTVIFETLNKFQ